MRPEPLNRRIGTNSKAKYPGCTRYSTAFAKREAPGHLDPLGMTAASGRECWRLGADWREKPPSRVWVLGERESGTEKVANRNLAARTAPHTRGEAASIAQSRRQRPGPPISAARMADGGASGAVAPPIVRRGSPLWRPLSFLFVFVVVTRLQEEKLPTARGAYEVACCALHASGEANRLIPK